MQTPTAIGAPLPLFAAQAATATTTDPGIEAPPAAIPQDLGDPTSMSNGEIAASLGTAIAGVVQADRSGQLDSAEVLGAAQDMVTFGTKAMSVLDARLADDTRRIESLQASGAPREQIEAAQASHEVLQALRDVIAKHTERLAEILRRRGMDPDHATERQLDDEHAVAEHAARVAELTAPAPAVVQPAASVVAAAYMTA